MKDKYDVVVIGAGPVGGYVAGNVSKEGYKVALIEQQKRIGSHLGCAGLVTSRVFEFLKINLEEVIQNNIKGANIHSPDGTILTVGGYKTHAYAIDRMKFDKKIIDFSIENNTDLILENRVNSIQRRQKEIELKTSKKNEIKCNLLIGADGPYSKTRDVFLLPKPSEVLRGVGAELIDTNLDPNFVEIFVGKNIAPGFFAWIIPINKKGTCARAGLCISPEIKKSPKYYFSKFLKNNYSYDYIGDSTITDKLSGNIPLGPLKKSYDSNILLAGDAAAQVKPTSGGGIYTGILCGKHCYSVVVESLKKKDFSSIFLKKYHQLWNADLGRELNFGMRFRRLFKKLSDKQFNTYISRFQNKNISKIISDYGDIDSPSKLVKPILKKAPYLIKLLPSMF